MIKKSHNFKNPDIRKLTANARFEWLKSATDYYCHRLCESDIDLHKS